MSSVGRYRKSVLMLGAGVSTQDILPGEGTDTISLKRSRMDSIEEIWMLMLSLNRMLRRGEGWRDDDG